MTRYPFVPRSNVHLEPGQFWSVPLPDGRFGCGRVLAIDRSGAYGARTLFTGALHDWVGTDVPTSAAIAGSPVIAIGRAHVRVIADGGGEVLGLRPLGGDGIEVPDQVSTFWGPAYPGQRLARRFIDGDPPPTAEVRVVGSPVTDEMLAPSATGRGTVQFRSRLTDDDFRRLGAWFADYPEMGLRAYGSYDGSIRDLEFLRFFPSLRSFWADALWDHLASSDGLRHLRADLDELGLGATRRPLDLAILGRFRDLRSLYLEGQRKNLAVVSTLTTLEELTLRSITLPDLRPLLPLGRLRSLDLKLGGTRDLALLPEVGTLHYLELWLIRGLDDVSMIGRMPALRSLFLQALRRVTQLPDLSAAASLRRVALEGMGGLSDLTPLATAPALEDLLLIEMRHLQPEALRPLVGHPRLRAATVGLGSDRRNRAAAELLGLPRVTERDGWRTG